MHERASSGTPSGVHASRLGWLRLRITLSIACCALAGFWKGSDVPMRPRVLRVVPLFCEPHDHKWRLIVRGEIALYRKCVRMEATLKPFYSQNASFHPILILIPDTLFGGLSGWLLICHSSCVTGHACSAATFQDLQRYALDKNGPQRRPTPPILCGRCTDS